MKYVKERVNVDLTLDRVDAERFIVFLEKTGRKRAPFIRALILETLDSWEGISNDQASDLRRMMKEQTSESNSL